MMELFIRQMKHDVNYNNGLTFDNKALLLDFTTLYLEIVHLIA